MNFFFANDTSEGFLDTPGPKIPYLGHFSGLSGVSGNTWQLPGVSRCIQVYPKKNFSGRRPEKFFFDRVSRPPPEKFFSQKKIFFSHLYLFMLE